MLRLPAEFAAGAFGADAAVGAERVGGTVLAEFLRRLRERPGLRRAQLQAARDRGTDVAIGSLAILVEIEGTRWCLLERQAIDVGHVLDMDIRPDVQALADMAHHARRARTPGETRYLRAVAREAKTIAVDHGRAHDDGAHAA